MKHIKAWLRALSAPRNTCANGHKSVIMLPNGRQKCLDCQAEW